MRLKAITAGKDPGTWPGPGPGLLFDRDARAWIYDEAVPAGIGGGLCWKSSGIPAGEGNEWAPLDMQRLEGEWIAVGGGEGSAHPDPYVERQDCLVKLDGKIYVAFVGWCASEGLDERGSPADWDVPAWRLSATGKSIRTHGDIEIAGGDMYIPLHIE
jgi:hypothetical protein